MGYGTLEIRLRYIPTEKQRLAHISPATFTHYGGAVGGGKSVFLVNEAFQQCLDWPGNRVGLFRWENRSFRDSTYETMETWLPHELVENHNRQLQHIKFLNGSLLLYGGIQPSSAKEDRLARLKSLELGSACIDEVTEVPKEFYDLLRIRIGRVWVTDPRTGKRIRAPKKLFSTSNPEPGWVKHLFIDNLPSDHAFIPSTLKDNPHLGDDYEDTLRASLPQEWIERYVEGDWSVLSVFNAVFPSVWVQRAFTAQVLPTAPTVLGVDIATTGNDLIIIARRRGFHVDFLFEGKHQTTMETANQVAMFMDAYKADVCNIDAIGVGAGVADRVAEMGYPVNHIIAGERANDPSRFVNLRAEMHWGVRQLLEANLIRLPNDPQLLQEMTPIKYMITSGRKIQIESKEQMAKRSLKSPNKNDAIIMAFAGCGLGYVIGGAIQIGSKRG